MNVANLLTLSRVILAFLCVGLTLQSSRVALIGAFVLFLLASLTDFLDGFIARKQGVVSDLGKLLDPVADKILILGVFLAFLVINVISIWMVIVIMMREFIITGVRLFALNKGLVLAARRFGKHKTFSQMLGINYIFVVLICRNMFEGNVFIGYLYNNGIPLLMWYVVIVTAFSGVHYLWANRKIIKNF